MVFSGSVMGIQSLFKTHGMTTTDKRLTAAAIQKSSICKKYFSNTQQPVSLEEFITVANTPLVTSPKEALLLLLALYFDCYSTDPGKAKIIGEVCQVYLNTEKSYFEEVCQVSSVADIVQNEMPGDQAFEPKKLPFVAYEAYINTSFALIRSKEIPKQVQGLFLKNVFLFLKSRPYKPFIVNKNFKKLSAARVLQTKSLAEFLHKKSLHLLPYFMEVVNTPSSISIKEVLHALIQGFCNNCGVSIGKRTVYWDIAWEILTRNKSLWQYDDEDPDLSDYIKTHIDNSAQYLDYDVAILNAHQFLQIAYTIVREKEIRPALYPVVFRYFLLYFEDAYAFQAEEDF